MVVTNNSQRNPAKDAMRVVYAIQNSPNWDSIYAEILSGYEGKDRTLLAKAIDAISVREGLDCSRIRAGLEKVTEAHEQERKSFGSEVRVGIDGREEVFGSAYDPNSAEDYQKFAESMTAGYQAPGFRFNETGIKGGEGKLQSDFEAQAEAKLDDFFGDL